MSPDEVTKRVGNLHRRMAATLYGKDLLLLGEELLEVYKLGLAAGTAQLPAPTGTLKVINKEDGSRTWEIT